MKARIYQRPKNAMQSGHARTGQWVLAVEPEAPQHADPLTGWAGSGNTAAQVQLTFPDRDAAIAYAKAQGFDYAIVPLGSHTLKLQAYADNFR
jgi:hypothetical protein